jgi:putative aldouronate transport system substrate-binding protein
MEDNNMKRLFSLAVLLALGFSFVFAGGQQRTTTQADTNGPVPLRIMVQGTYRGDWLTIQKLPEMFNVNITWETIPTDYATKASLALNTGIDVPDIMLQQTIQGENVALAINGAIVPISDYAEWTPNFYSWIDKFNIRDDLNRTKLRDGKIYCLTALYDNQFYDAGFSIREDILKKYNADVPKTFDELLVVLRRYKAENPGSYPLIFMGGSTQFYRMTMPSWGVNANGNNGGSRTLSWDYDKEEYFPGAVSQEYRDYMRYWRQAYAEGLIDPEFSSSRWEQKLATGSSIATYAYFDQLGTINDVSEIPGFKLGFYPTLRGPRGAYSNVKSKTGGGIIFPAATAKRPDFERVVRAVDNMFFSEEAVVLWHIGVEGVTYTTVNGQVKFIDSILNAPTGIYKYMQEQYGCGWGSYQHVWVNAWEMRKYPEEYAETNRQVAAMSSIRYIPPIPLFDEAVAERVSTLNASLFDTWNVWNEAFLTGTRSLETDWNAYVAEMERLGINEYLALYNNNL